MSDCGYRAKGGRRSASGTVTSDAFRPGGSYVPPSDAGPVQPLDSHLWHLFTQQQGWPGRSRSIERAEGDRLVDAEGRYIDGISSLWCNVHGHRHAGIDKAVRDQLDRVAHSTMLGLTHGRRRPSWPSALIGTRPWASTASSTRHGSTAIEIALKMAFQYWQQRGGESPRGHPTSASGTRTTGTRWDRSRSGASTCSLAYGPLLFDAHHVAPGDAAELECVLVSRRVRSRRSSSSRSSRERRDPDASRPATCAARAELCDRHDVFLICDEVATGFGRPARCSPASRSGSTRPPVPGEGPDRRLPAAGGDAHDRAGLRGVPRRPRGVPHVLPRPHLHREPARLRRGPGEPRRVRGGTLLASSSRRSACSAELLSGIARLPGGRRDPRPRLHGRHRPRRARSRPAAGHRVTLAARERGAIVRPLGDVDRPDAAARDLEGRAAPASVAIVAATRSPRGARAPAAPASRHRCGPRMRSRRRSGAGHRRRRRRRDTWASSFAPTRERRETASLCPGSRRLGGSSLGHRSVLTADLQVAQERPRLRRECGDESAGAVVGICRAWLLPRAMPSDAEAAFEELYRSSRTTSMPTWRVCSATARRPRT